MLDLKRRIFKPVYFLSGAEAYYIDAISDYIENNVLDAADKEFNQTVVYGKDVELSAIISLARQFPMMSEYNVVIVKEAQNIRELNKSADEEGEGTPSGSGLQQLQAYVQNPQPSTILVFCYKYKTIDKRSALAKALQKHAVFFEGKKLYENQVPAWIGSYVKDNGYTIGPKATFLLSEYLGNDLGKIANEISKLFINLPEGKEITAELVQDNIGMSKDHNVFELQDALTKKDILKANRIINYFAANEREHPNVMILALLFGYFSKLLRYHYLKDKNKGAVAAALGINPFFVDGIAAAAHQYPPGKLQHIFACLKECDLKSKGVNNYGVSQGELMKELVFNILH